MPRTRAVRLQEVAGERALRDAFMQFHHTFFKAMRREAERLELSVSQIELLRFVAEHTTPTMKDIAAHLHITAPSATSLIAHLVDKRLVERLADPNDRRGVRIKMTRRAHDLLGAIQKTKEDVLSEFMAQLSNNEKTQLTSLLHKVLNQ